MNEEDKKRKIKRKVSELEEKLKKSHEINRQFKEKIIGIEDDFDTLKLKIERNEWDGDWARKVITGVMNTGSLVNDDNFPKIVDRTNYFLGEYNSQMTGVTGTIDDIRHRVNSLYSEVSQSTLNMGSGIALLDSWLEEPINRPAYHSVISQNPRNNPYYEKNIFISKLKKFTPKLLNSWEDIQKSFTNLGGIKMLKSTAHMMREFMSILLQFLSPDDEVKGMKWRILQNRRVTQRSRTVYSILGKDDSFDWTIEKYKNIIKIANIYRDLYVKLNKIAHIRGRINIIQIRIDLRAYFEDLQNYTMHILELRERNYKPLK